jgi:SAM-dependent methyltransferase
MYLAQSGYNVTAIDFCSSALGQLKEKYNESFVTGSLHTTLCDITETLPFANNSFDAVFDIVTTTSISHDQMKCFELELRRVIEPGGILVSYVHSNGDGYLQSVAPGEDAYVIQDNQIIDHTWTKAELESLYARWDVLHFRHVEKTDTLAGRNYTRRLWYLVLRNRE